MSGHRHIIRRQTLIIDAADPERKAAALQEHMRDLYLRRLLPVVDRCCSRWSPAGVRHRIDRLEIDLGEVDLEQIDENWIALAAATLERELGRVLRQTRSADLSTADPSAAELLQVFLRQGVLPWWVDAAVPDAVEKAAGDLMAAGPASNSFFYRLKIELGSREPAARRLTQALPDEMLTRLTGRLFSPSAPMEAWIAAMRADLSARPGWSVARRSFWSHLWSSLALDLLADRQAERAWAEWRKRDLLPPDAPVRWPENLEQTGELRPGKPEQSGDAFPDADKKRALEAPEEDQSPHRARDRDAPSARERMDSDTASELVGPLTPAEAEEDRTDFPDTGEDIEEWYIYNAGLVLLTPFIPPLFRQMGWTDGTAFTSAEQTMAAIAWLQYLCDGQDEPPEYQLAMNKILCGLPPEALFEPGRPLTMEERQAADELLAAALEQAPGLGLTTIDGLRGSFLLRRGILRPSGNHWLLHVEGETYDIVLTRVPWSYQVVRLPWMEAPIRVDWSL